MAFGLAALALTLFAFGGSLTGDPFAPPPWRTSITRD